jgi:cytochrome P450 family 6
VCNRDYKIPGSDYVIKKDTHIGIPIYPLHHDQEHYPNPEQFDPQRFNVENKAKRNPYSYMPFGQGPRSCIGKSIRNNLGVRDFNSVSIPFALLFILVAMRFALVEGKAAVAHLVLNFKLSPSSQTLIPMKFSTKGLMKPANGMWLNLEARK